MRNPLTIVSEFLTKHLSGSEKMNHENEAEKFIFAGDKEREKRDIASVIKKEETILNASMIFYQISLIII